MAHQSRAGFETGVAIPDEVSVHQPARRGDEGRFVLRTHNDSAVVVCQRCLSSSNRKVRQAGLTLIAAGGKLAAIQATVLMTNR